MEIRLEPYNLQITDDTITKCPCCNNILLKEVKKASYFINGECGYCRYLDRPFASYSNSWQQHYPEGCFCQYGEKDFIYITCENCKSPKCTKCNKSLNCCNKNCGSVICNLCIEKKEFNYVWKTTTPQEKLELYGIEKLRILAKNKKFKGYTKYKKHELIILLLPMVNESDFPIKKLVVN